MRGLWGFGPLVLLLLAAMVAAACPWTLAAQETGTDRPPMILIVNRAQVLAESAAARALATSERELGATLQAEVDRVQAELALEEEELARVRGSMPREAFEARAGAFRARVQRERRAAQAQAAAIDKVFREARRELVNRLQPILEEVRRRKGADVIINADSVLAARPEADVTGEVLLVFDARVPPPEITIPEPQAPPAVEEEAPEEAPE
ncbi:MAG: OmpH family outer membrane protein [Pseudomonadota bacterium]